MNKKMIKSVSTIFIFSILLILNSCNNKPKKADKKEAEKEVAKTVYPSDVIPFFDHWKLILGDGSNAGIANNFENKDFFYATNDKKEDWVVFKSPNGGNTHGTSNNTRTELA